MNIKSNLSTPVLWFKSITVGTLIFSFIIGVSLSILIISFGTDIVLKIMFLLVGGFIALVGAYDSSNSGTSEEKDADARRNGVVIIIAFLISEIGLFYASDYSKVIPISSIVTNEQRTEVIKRDDNNNVIESKTIPFKRVTYYNLNNNSSLGYRDVEENEEAKLEFLTNIVAKEFYIEYTPFLTYSEEYKYKRK